MFKWVIFKNYTYTLIQPLRFFKNMFIKIIKCLFFNLKFIHTKTAGFIIFIIICNCLHIDKFVCLFLRIFYTTCMSLHLCCNHIINNLSQVVCLWQFSRVGQQMKANLHRELEPNESKTSSITKGLFIQICNGFLINKFLKFMNSF